jgi:predicted nucleotidyltransferase
MMNHGLSNRDIQTIKDIFNRYPDVEKVWLFGSRAIGNYHKGSDIDLAVMNEGISNKTIQSLVTDFEESSLPYFVDVIYFPELKHAGLNEHIKSVGRSFYIKDTVSVLSEKKADYKSGKI